MFCKLKKSFFTSLLSLLGVVSILGSQLPQDFANNIKDAVENGNSVYINQKFDHNEFSINITKNNKDLTDIEITEKLNLTYSLDPGALIQSQVNTSDNYTCINITQSSEHTKLVFRVNSEKGLDYHEYYIKLKNGLYSIVDIYMYFNDILLSRDINRLFKTENQNNFEENLAELFYARKHKRVLKLYTQNRFTPEGFYYALKASSYSNTNYMYKLISSNTSGLKHRGINLYVLEGLFEQKEYSLVLEHINKLDASVGFDPYLNYLRASVYKAQNKLERAEWLLNKTITDLPEEQIMYFSLLEVYLGNDKFSNASLLLQQLVDNFGFYKEDLQPLLASYPSYLISAEYIDWQNR